MRLLPLSRIRRDLNSSMRRGDTVVVTRCGKCMAKLEPVVSTEQMNEATRRRGASVGVLAHVEADLNMTDDESLADAKTKRGRDRNIDAELLESVRAVKAGVNGGVHPPPGAMVLGCVDVAPLGELSHEDLAVGRQYVGRNMSPCRG